MPHLSPMNWLVAPLLFLMITLPFLISFIWWSQLPFFPIITNTNSNNKTAWNWS